MEGFVYIQPDHWRRIRLCQLSRVFVIPRWPCEFHWLDVKPAVSTHVSRGVSRARFCRLASRGPFSQETAGLEDVQ